jgi:TonB family protein
MAIRAPHSSMVMTVGVALGLLAPAMVVAQSPRLPPASGRVLEAQDGDTVIVGASSRVAIVRRTQGEARLLYAADRRALALILEPTEPDLAPFDDGKRFRSWVIAKGEWPLGPRWSGQVTVDEYLPSGLGAPGGVAIHTDRGVVFVGHLLDFQITPTPIAVLQSNSSRASSAPGTLDEVEQRWLAGGDDAVARTGVQSRMGVSSVVRSAPSAAPAGAVRVGGNIRVPTRLNQVAPVYPQQAKDASVQGVVILEIIVSADGSVSEARVLRSIPMLDDAALECVRQWRYEPTLLNGAPVPVIMTVTVNFTLDR